MSHFSVLVIGPDVDDQMAPYHQFECTGINNEYVLDVDVTEECFDYATRIFAADGRDPEANADDFIGTALSYHGLDDKIVSTESEVDRKGAHEYGYALVVDGKLVKAVDRTNPNYKWDWYEVGGRWGGFFKLKSGGWGDFARKKDIDFEGMRDEAGEDAAEKWDKAFAAHGGASWEDWETVRAKHPDSVEDAREEYWVQPAVDAISKAFDSPWVNPDQYLVTRDEYVTAARNSAVNPFALVKNAKWHEKGEMLMFGRSNDKMTQAEWNSVVGEIIDSLPDDTLLTIVDCHI